jgi:putative hemolysin
LQWTTRRMNSILGDGASVRGSITESEFRTLIDVGEAEGTFEPEEAEMLENVFRFGDRQVREVMTPRTEIAFVERGATLNQFLAIYVEHSHTRFPVYKETTDNVIGIISAKDILKTMSTRGIKEEESVTDVIRDAYFVPETKRIAELFGELRQSGNQMAIAVDEYGGLAGLVTLKRLSEEVVGPVGEEGAGPEEEYEAIDRNTYQVDGGMSIDDVNEELGINLPEGDFETIAGFALQMLGHIPTEGRQFEYKNLKFEIIEMKDLKIETVKVTKTHATESGAQLETDTGQARRNSTE